MMPNYGGSELRCGRREDARGDKWTRARRGDGMERRVGWWSPGTKEAGPESTVGERATSRLVVAGG